MYKVVQELADGLPEQWAERAVEVMRRLRAWSEGPVRVSGFDALAGIVMCGAFADLCAELEMRPAFRDGRVEFVSDKVPGTVFALSLRDDGGQSCETCAFRTLDVFDGVPRAMCAADREELADVSLDGVCARYARQNGV